MAEQVIFGKTSKRINSISQTYTPVITTNVLLKEPCSIVAPVFLVKQNYATLRECNYCQYAGFYYYITDIVSVRNKHVEVHCSRDALASFADDIRASSAYCLFADRTHSDLRLEDPRMNPEVLEIDSRTDKVINFNCFDTDGSYMLTAYGQWDIDKYGVRTYAMNLTTFNTFIQSINQGLIGDIQSGTDVKEVIKKGIINVFSSGPYKDDILSCYWVPTRYSWWGQHNYDMGKIALGAFVSDLEAYVMSPSPEVKLNEEAYTIPFTADANTYPWLRGPKYSSVQLCHPGGNVEIGNPELIDNRTIYINTVYLTNTGDYLITCKTGAAHGKIFGTASGTLRRDITNIAKADGHTTNDVISDIARTTTSAAVSLFSVAAAINNATTSTQRRPGNVANDNKNNNTHIADYTPNVLSAASGITGAFVGTGPKVSTAGTSLTSSTVGLYKDGDDNMNNSFYINVVCAFPRCIKDANYEHFCNRYGWPAHTMLYLGDIDGYVQTVGASLIITGCTQAELSTINSNLNSGIYIEA